KERSGRFVTDRIVTADPLAVRGNHRRVQVGQLTESHGEVVVAELNHRNGLLRLSCGYGYRGGSLHTVRIVRYGKHEVSSRFLGGYPRGTGRNRPLRRRGFYRNSKRFVASALESTCCIAQIHVLLFRRFFGTAAHYQGRTAKNHNQFR